MLRLLGVRLHVKHRERFHSPGKGRLIVANHVSYLDILIIASLVPSVFITSVELGGTLLLGTLARLGGSMFVERRKATGLKQEIGLISRTLEDGFTVVLFPEGTTSNGERVHPFKKSLFDAAVDTQTDVLPLCLRYTAVNDEELTSRNRDSVFFYGGTTFLQHVPRLLALRSVDVEVLPLAVLRVHQDSSRKDLAEQAYDAISAAYPG